MKKKLLLLTASLLALTGGLLACAEEKEPRYDVNLDDYEYVYNQEFVDEHDPFMTIDGLLDEEVWQNQNYLSYSSSDIDFSYSTLLTEKGVYISAQAVDPNIFYYGRFDMHHNSGFTIYVLARENKDYKTHPMYRLRLETDSAGDRRSYTQVRFNAATQVEWEEGSTVSGTMTSEFFVSWEALRVDTSNGIPDDILIEPVYRQRSLNSSGKVVLKDIYPIFTEPDWPGHYFSFDRNGYGNPDLADCEVGNGGMGLTKTDRWDLSEGANGKVTSYGYGEEVIFYKNVNAKNVYLSAKVNTAETEGVFGLIAHANRKFTYRTFHLSASSLAKGKIDLRASKRANEMPDLGLYQEVGGLYSGELQNASEVELSLIKAGTQLYFFVNGRYVYSEDIGAYLMSEVSLGFYTNGCIATFYDYEAGVLADDEVQAKINEYGAAVIQTPGAISGGSVTSKYMAVNHGDSYDLTIKPNVGYVLTSLTVNDEDKYADVYEKLDKTIYTVEDSGTADKIEVNATFKRVTSLKRVSLEGTLYASKGTKVTIPSATITIRSESCSLLYYQDGSSSKGVYYIDYLPVAGTVLTTVNGEEIVCDGKYTMTISAYGYNTYEKKIELTEDSVNTEEDITLQVRELGGVATLEGKWTYGSNTAGWYLEKESQGVVEANHGSAYNPLVFTDKIGTKAIIEYTFENKTGEGDEYEPQPGIGFVIKNSAYTLGVILVGGSVRVLPNMAWNDQSYVKPASVAFNTSDRNKPTTVRFVHDEDMFAIFVKVADEWKLAYKEIYPGLNADSAYGIMITEVKKCHVVFTDYSIQINEEAEEFIYGQFYKSVTVDEENSDAKITVIGATNGFIRAGRELQISADKNTVISVNGKKYLYLGKPITVVVEEAVVISSEAIGETVTLQGNLIPLDVANTDGMNFSSTLVTLRSADAEYTVMGAVYSDGEFRIIAPKGEYEATFAYEYFLKKTVALTADVENEVAFTMLRPAQSVSTDTYTTTDGSDYVWEETENSITSYLAKNAARELKYFAVWGEKYVAQTTIHKLDISGANGADKYPMAGITLRNAKAGYSFLIQDYAGAGNNQVALYFVSTTGAYSTIYLGKASYADGKITLAVVCDGTKIDLYANKQHVRTITADTTLTQSGTEVNISKDFIGSTTVVGLSSVGQRATFSDFFASAKEEYVNELATSITKCKVEIVQAATGEKVLVNGGESAYVSVGGKAVFTTAADRAVLVVDGKSYTLTAEKSVELTVTADMTVKVVRLAENVSDTGVDIYPAK